MAQLWPQATLLPGAIKALSPLPSPAQAARVAAQVPSIPPRASSPWIQAEAPGATPGAGYLQSSLPQPALINRMIVSNETSHRVTLLGTAASIAPSSASAALRLAAQPDHLPPQPDRWSAAAWLVVRPGMGLGAAPGGSQLGGSQAGVRVAWLLDSSARLALFGRVTAPLRGRGAEAAIGVEWQPGKAPLRLAVERRVGLDGTTGGFGAGVVGGTDGEIAPGFRLESYGQAGAIRRDRIEPYADGAARLTRQVVGSGNLRLSVGAGIWGAAQRDAGRLDIGPSVTLAVPVARQSIRLALDWRQRIAGEARPGSGLALTLGSDL